MLKARDLIGLKDEAALMLKEWFDVAAENMAVTEVLFVPTGMNYDAEYLSALPNLKAVASNTTGDDHIDVAHCKERGIEVITLKDDPVLGQLTGVVELTIGFIVMLTRNVTQAAAAVKCGEWDRYPYGGRFMLRRLSIGIIGAGRLGSMLGVWTRTMGMATNFFDIQYPMTTMTFNAALQSDIVSIHIPVEGNIGFFDRDMIGRFADGAYLINTSRGEVIDEQALVEALASGKIAGVATDVISGEFERDFNLEDSVLWRYAQGHDNVIITPHIGGSTGDSWRITQARIVQKAKEFSDSYLREQAVNQ